MQRQAVSAHFSTGGLQFHVVRCDGHRPRTPGADVVQERGAGEVGEAGQWDIIGGAAIVLLDVLHLFARGDHTQTRVPGCQSLE
jgi:hypothetical protein